MKKESADLAEVIVNSVIDALPGRRVNLRTPFRTLPERGEQYTKPSYTVPDMAMTIQEILHRFSAGRAPMFAQTLHYTGETYMPEMRGMDLIDQQEALEANRERLKKLEAEVSKKRSERSEALKKRKERIDAFLAAEDAATKDDKNQNITNNERSKAQ